MIELTEQEIKQLINYLASKPLSESYSLFNMLINKVENKEANDEVDKAKVLDGK